MTSPVGGVPLWAVQHGNLPPIIPTVSVQPPGNRSNAEAYINAHPCCRIVECYLVSREDVDALNRQMEYVQKDGMTSEARHFARTWGQRFRSLFLKAGWRPTE